MTATLVAVSTATLVVVAGLNYHASRRTLKSIEGNLTASIENKGNGLVTNQALALRDMVMDNAFGDVARLLERTVEKDEQLVYALFLDEDGKSWGVATRHGFSKDPDEWKRLAIDGKDLRSTAKGLQMRHRQVFGQRVFEFSMLVVDDKGAPLGKLFYGISAVALQRALADARADSRRNLFVTVGLLLLLGTVTIVMGAIRSRSSAVRITQPVIDLTEAVNTLASGKRDIRVQISSGDELEILGGAFNKMVAELKDSYARLETMNRTLEIKVQERTRELAERNRDMRLVMDNVNQGFLTVSITGKLAHERSAIIDRWFGSYEGDTQFCDYIAQSDPCYAACFEISYEALIEDILPRALCIQQLPARLGRDGREYRCSYFPILEGERLSGLLIVINDVTSELWHARQEAERKEILAMFEALTKDRGGFLNFMDEANEILKQVRQGDLAAQKRGLHTLKGNAGLVGFGVVAKLCHQAEDDLVDRSAPLPAESLAPLDERWRTLSEALRTFLGDKGRDVLELSRREIEKLEQEVLAGTPAMRVLDRLASWCLEPAALPLGRLGRYAAALAGRLGKGDLEVEIQPHGVRLAPEAWSGFWADLVHVVRNAVDHGIDSPAERQAMGKGSRPRLRLSSLVTGHELAIEIEDFGRGIDWDAVRAAAIKHGLPSATEEDLIAAMFHSGLSTAAEITTVSGRGLGLTAMRQRVDELGGHIAVVSKTKQGTCFRFTFTLPDVGPRFGVDSSAEVPSQAV